MTAENTELAVKVTRPDGSVAQVGPIEYEHVAQDIHRYFIGEAATSREGAAECQVTIVPFDPSLPSLPLVPAHADTVHSLMDHPEQGCDTPFPDLWDRLRGQHGYGTAERVWGQACRIQSHLEEGMGL